VKPERLIKQPSAASEKDDVPDVGELTPKRINHEGDETEAVEYPLGEQHIDRITHDAASLL
jgi:hypothetical protein